VLTDALEGVPGSTAVRGLSMSGMAYVDVVFGSSASLARGREAIVERLGTVRNKLPAYARVQVGPLASSTGWVFQYAVVDRSHGQTPLALRALQDDVLRPALTAIRPVSPSAAP
jgi:Cu(I)/Ag(I) efflux system membrane protein CusA/SilA